MAEEKPERTISIGGGVLQISLVNTEDTVGTVLISVIALLLVIALMRSHSQNRKLIERGK